MSEENGELAVTAGTQGVSVSAKGKKMAELVAIASCVGLVMVAYMVYEHRVEAKQSGTELSVAIKDLARSQREMTCIIALPPEKREAEYQSPFGFCKRVSQ